jgi:hypothetical protein
MPNQKPCLARSSCQAPVHPQPVCSPCLQVRAIFEAAVACTKEGVVVKPDIMVPLVGTALELANQEALIRSIGAQVMKESGVNVEYKVGGGGCLGNGGGVVGWGVPCCKLLWRRDAVPLPWRCFCRGCSGRGRGAPWAQGRRFCFVALHLGGPGGCFAFTLPLPQARILPSQPLQHPLPATDPPPPPGCTPRRWGP